MNFEDPLNHMNAEFKVTPWEVSGDISYDYFLVEKFGTKRIDDALMDRLWGMGRCTHC